MGRQLITWLTLPTTRLHAAPTSQDRWLTVSIAIHPCLASLDGTGRARGQADYRPQDPLGSWPLGTSPPPLSATGLISRYAMFSPRVSAVTDALCIQRCPHAHRSLRGT